MLSCGTSRGYKSFFCLFVFWIHICSKNFFSLRHVIVHFIPLSFSLFGSPYHQLSSPVGENLTFPLCLSQVPWEKSSIKPSLSLRRFETDVAKIFNINVSNTIEGGASNCLPCFQVRVYSAVCLPSCSIRTGIKLLCVLSLDLCLWN